ncbi:hypothetical protein TRVL_05329 [Trypanosoma vivax]|nr:hypothetical protein TRVL_05329 [Trypanosoma vivax]
MKQAHANSPLISVAAMAFCPVLLYFCCYHNHASCASSVWPHTPLTSFVRPQKAHVSAELRGASGIFPSLTGVVRRFPVRRSVPNWQPALTETATSQPCPRSYACRCFLRCRLRATSPAVSFFMPAPLFPTFCSRFVVPAFRGRGASHLVRTSRFADTPARSFARSAPCRPRRSVFRNRAAAGTSSALVGSPLSRR